MSKIDSILRSEKIFKTLINEELIKKQHLERWNERLLEDRYLEDEIKSKEPTEEELMIASYYNELSDNYNHSNRRAY